MGASIGWGVREGGVLAPVVVAPEAGEDVCVRCRGWTRPGLSVCFPCRMVEGQVARPCTRVAVASVYRPGGVMHRALRAYKDGSGGLRRVLSARVGAFASQFLWREGPGLAPGGWDAVAVVPSSAGRPGPHPLEDALATFDWLAPQLWSGVLVAGPRPAGHRRAADDAYRADPAVAGARILLVDDTWATGARAQSAASALDAAGAEVVGIAVLGRIVTPRAGAPTGEWWSRHAGPPPDARPGRIRPVSCRESAPRR